MVTLQRLAWVGVAASIVAGAQAESLYAASAAGGAGRLCILNASNGAVIQDIGALNDATGANYGITGLAFNPITGVLYGSSANADPGTRAKLVTINPLTAAVTLVGNFNAGPTNASGVPATMADIAFDSQGNLFGIGSIGGPQLYSINTATGQATVIGSTGLTSTTGGGLAISAGGTFFGTPTASRFGTYNSGTGTYTNITNPVKPVGGAYAALAFNAAGTLYGLNLGSGSPPPTHLVTMDSAGNVTDLGASLNSLDAIAFGPSPVPEPATLAAMGLGLAAMVSWRRRKN